MRTTFSSVAVLASSLLAREVFAAPHLHKHKRDVVTDLVVVTELVTVTDDNGLYETAAPAAIGTTTINGTPVTVSTTPAATPASTEAPATSALPVSPSSEASTSTSGAVFLQEPKSSSAKTEASSTPETTAEPTTTTPVVAPTTSSPAVVPTTSSAVEIPTTLATSTSSSPTPSTSSSSSSGKRGLAYNDAGLLSGFVSTDSLVSWAYNWASSTSSIPSGLEYVPILWGTQDEFTSTWNANADSALAAGSTHLMSFNEPDYSGQADLTVDAAVSGYMQYVNSYASKAQLGTPAVTNGAAPMGLTYLQNFITGLNGAGGSYDFCAIHWYDSATNIAYFKNYMQEASTTCGSDKKIWLTEFGASGSADEQNTFLQTVLPWMDEQDYIERYAYFMVTPGNLISTGTSLSTLGATYASFT